MAHANLTEEERLEWVSYLAGLVVDRMEKEGAKMRFRDISPTDIRKLVDDGLEMARVRVMDVLPEEPTEDGQVRHG